MKKLLVLVLALAMIFAFAACNSQQTPPVSAPPVEDEIQADEDPVEEEVVDETHEPVTLLVAAAASLENAFKELIPAFQAQYDWITVEGAYDSSGKLQTQIEEGLAADIFVSAANKQMDALVESAHINADSVVGLLENKVVLIESSAAPTGLTDFAEVIDFDGVVALGDPGSVPAGQYAEEIFTSLGVWDGVLAKASLGTNVTEVLNWVAAGSAGLGVVYATDAASKTGEVAVIAEAPEGSLAAPVIYPLGILAHTEQAEATQLLYEFLQGPEASAIFESYGFTINK